MTTVKEILSKLQFQRVEKEKEIDWLIEDVASLNERIAQIYAELADLDRSIHAIKRVDNDQTKPTFDL